MNVLEMLTEEECYLYSILTDPSGLDQAEFLWADPEADDGVWRAWDFQHRWFRNIDPLQIDQAARSVGKSLSIKLRAFAFPFLHPGQEMVVTAPELVHLNPIIGLVETQVTTTRLTRELLPKKPNFGITHRPLEIDFLNGARLFGRIPQRDGKGMKGCQTGDTPIVTERGIIRTDELKVGDRVLTHKGRWKPVEAIYTDVNDAYEVRGQSSFPMTVSCDHRFYGMNNTGTNKTKRKFDGQPMFYDVEYLLEDQIYWATPTEFPAVPIPPVIFAPGTREFTADGTDFWWLVGRYLADGHVTAHRPGGKSGSVNWCVVPAQAAEITDRLMAIGLSFRIEKRDHSSADIVSCNSSPWRTWLLEHFGKLAYGKKLPSFALGMDRLDRAALLAGYLSGDGHVNKQRDRIQVETASKTLAVGLQLLAQSLDYSVNCSEVQPKVTHINGVELKSRPRMSYRLQLLTSGHPVRQGQHLYSKIKSVTPVGKVKVYNPIIEDDHSYVSGSIVSHNVHPLWLETDEAQDYPAPGFVETIETLKRGHEGAVWRCHGVTKGVRDYFYKFTQPASGWTVHRIVAMMRPTWSDAERTEKIEQYGSRDHPDYKRNILGLHGDATNPMLVLSRLMACVDDNETSDYNQSEYAHFRINPEMIMDQGGDILEMLRFPDQHRNPAHLAFWVGMDVGFTSHPSEIVVFAELKGTGDRPSWLKLVTRIHLERISHGDQVRAILHTINWYKPKAFSMDKTGLGLPLFQEIQENWPDNAHFIKGYVFNGKILVDIDKTIEVDEFNGDLIKEAGIERNVLEYASDTVRDYVDRERILFPWDTDLIGELQGQTYVVVRDNLTLYGKKSYSLGKFHALDAIRMALLGKVQTPIEEMTRKEKWEPVVPIFVGF